jgi:hypothetical protein
VRHAALLAAALLVSPIACAPAPVTRAPAPPPRVAAAPAARPFSAPAPPPRVAATPAARPFSAPAPVVAAPVAPALLALPAAPTSPALRRRSAWRGQFDLPPDERARRAEATRRAVVEELFAAAKVTFPPGALLFRAFKQDKRLEVWAASEKGGRLSLITEYEICQLSGDLGPKRREGDMQVPEGFYKIQYLWPDSAFHLEMKVGYPNDLDRHLSEHTPEGPGGNIMIHGSCASAGCLAMTDERVEELWTMASAVHHGEERVHVHIFPARDLAGLLREPGHEDQRAFWENLKEGYDLFERTRRLPHVDADWHARYLFR